MAVRRDDHGTGAPDGPGETVVVRRSRAGRIAATTATVLLVFLLAVVAVIWFERKPIATHYLKKEFERRGVTASYTLDRIGFRTQQVSNLVVGDPRNPDLVAKRAIIQMRLKLDGSFEVYRIVARGVRLKGVLGRDGKVHWGQVDKLLPPPSNKPFKLPSITLDIADSRISLATPFGRVGVALQGNGNLRGGFKGRAALSSARLVPGKCVANHLRANVAVAVIATRPQIEGPVVLDEFNCPASKIAVKSPRFDAKASFNESFTRVDGSGRMAMSSFVAGANGLANFGGTLTYAGPLGDVRGRVQLAAQNSRLGTIYADRTRLDARYGLQMRAGKLNVLGRFAADSAKLDPAMIASITQPLDAAAKTPIGPVAKAMVEAIRRMANNFAIDGDIRAVNFPGGGAVRIGDSELRGPNGARARISGGSGVTYYWPSGGLRIDGDIQTNGGGLPRANVRLSQAHAGAPMNGQADVAPYVVGRTRLALSTIRFGPGPGNTTQVRALARLDGPFQDGAVRGLSLPVEGRIGQGGSFAFGTGCITASWDYLRSGGLQLGRIRLPVCPIGGAILSKSSGGSVQASARINRPVLNGFLGKSPFNLAAAMAEARGQHFLLNSLSARLGKSDAPIRFDAQRFTGTFAGSGINGTYSGATAVIGRVPLRLTEGAGMWKMHKGDISSDARLTVSDMAENPRFYPLKSDDVHFSLAGDYVRATGTLRHPASGTRVADINIEHRLSSGAGDALLDVPGITFNAGFQPDELTRLTQGVIALVDGTIRGQGRIDWTGSGKVTSTGDFSTQGMNLAFPFGPVEGATGTINFTDLLGLETAPGQTFFLKSVNPGILVENGTIKYQLLPGQLVKIERGEWPFMGGTLVLQETILNFSRPTAKRLTFEVIGLDAHTFVSSLGFKEFDATGRFDGVLPMIFDENGGRIVGGRLDARPGGGVLAYNGVVNRANLGLAGGFVFDAVRNLKYKSMVIRLDGDLDGEFLTRTQVQGVGLGETKAANFLRAIYDLPINLNLQIRGPFRALIATAKSFRDPRRLLDDVLPVPLGDIPGITTEVIRVDEQQSQTQTPPSQEGTVTKTPPGER